MTILIYFLYFITSHSQTKLCTADYLEKYFNQKACYLNGDQGACMLLASFDDGSENSLYAALGGGFAGSLLANQSKSAQAKFKDLLKGIRAERATLREAHKIKVKIDSEVAKELSNGKSSNRSDLPENLREKSDKLYNEKLMKAAQVELRSDIRQYLTGGSALSVYKTKTATLMENIYKPELDKLKPYYENLQSARDKLAAAQASGSDNIEQLKKEVGVQRKALAEVIAKSPELKIVNSLKFAVGYTLNGQNDVFKIASKTSREIDESAKNARAQKLNQVSRVSVLGAFTGATLTISEQYFNKKAVEECQAELGLTSKELKVLKGEFKTLVGQIHGNQIFKKDCTKLALLYPEEVLAAFNDEIPVGVCRIIQNEMVQLNNINLKKIEPTKLNCQEFSSKDFSVQGGDKPQAQFYVQGSIIVKTHIDAQTGWPQYRTATYYKNGKYDKNLTLKCQDEFNYKYPPSANLTDIDKLEFYLNKNSECMNVQNSALVRAIYSSTQAFCADTVPQNFNFQNNSQRSL